MSQHFDGKRFRNLDPVPLAGFKEILKWKLSATPKPWRVENKAPAKPHPAVYETVKSGRVSTTFINHSSLLVQTGGLNILTDPVWSPRASPVSWSGPLRHRQPGLAFADLPRIDAVLLSHNHYDHMDRATIKRLEATFHPRFFVPLGDAKLLKGWGCKRVEELDWWQSHNLSDAAKIVFAPAQHWSSRSPWDRCKSLWGSYLIHAGEHWTYFAGDTGYASHFKKIREYVGRPIDLSYLPIGAYEPRWFMKPMHMNPTDAAQAHCDLESKQSIGIHFGTFHLTDEGMDDPKIELQKALALQNIPLETFIVPVEGETYFDLEAPPSLSSESGQASRTF
jgi:L-ascorbate metabolism protein UlaG (beta-lactamase superfamily)